MDRFWNALGYNTSGSNSSGSNSNSNSNYAMDMDEPQPKAIGRRRSKPVHDEEYLIDSISEMPPPPPPSRSSKGSRNYDNRSPFQDSLFARIPKSLKEAEKLKKEADKEADRLRKEAEKEADRLRKEAEKEADRLRKQAEKEADKIKKQAEAEKERFRKQAAERERSTPAYDFSSFKDSYANANSYANPYTNYSSHRTNARTSSHSHKPSDYAYKPNTSSNSNPSASSNSNSNSSRNTNPSASSNSSSASRTSSVNAETSRLLEIIGLNQATTEVTGENIKKAYRLMAKKTHPDKNKDDPNATKKFQSVNTAYEKLKPMYNIAGGSKKQKTQKRRRTLKRK